MSDPSLPPAAAPPHVLEAAVYCDDLDAADAFYSGILGLERVQRVEGRHVFYRVGPGVLLVFDPDATARPSGGGHLPVPPHGARGPGHVCLAMPGAAIADWIIRFEAAGIEIEADFHWPNGARSVYVRDPAGNSVELAEPWLWTGSPR